MMTKCLILLAISLIAVECQVDTVPRSTRFDAEDVYEKLVEIDSKLGQHSRLECVDYNLTKKVDDVEVKTSMIDGRLILLADDVEVKLWPKTDSIESKVDIVSKLVKTIDSTIRDERSKIVVRQVGDQLVMVGGAETIKSDIVYEIRQNRDQQATIMSITRDVDTMTNFINSSLTKHRDSTNDDHREVVRKLLEISTTLTKNVDQVETKSKQLSTKVDRVQSQVETSTADVKKTIETVNSNLDKVSQSLTGRLAEVDNRLLRVDEKTNDLSIKFSEANSWQRVLLNRIDIASKSTRVDLSEVDRKVSNVESVLRTLSNKVDTDVLSTLTEVKRKIDESKLEIVNEINQVIAREVGQKMVKTTVDGTVPSPVPVNDQLNSVRSAIVTEVVNNRNQLNSLRGQLSDLTSSNNVISRTLNVVQGQMSTNLDTVRTQATKESEKTSNNFDRTNGQISVVNGKLTDVEKLVKSTVLTEILTNGRRVDNSQTVILNRIGQVETQIAGHRGLTEKLPDSTSRTVDGAKSEILRSMSVNKDIIDRLLSTSTETQTQSTQTRRIVDKSSDQLINLVGSQSQDSRDIKNLVNQVSTKVDRVDNLIQNNQIIKTVSTINDLVNQINRQTIQNGQILTTNGEFVKGNRQNLVDIRSNLLTRDDVTKAVNVAAGQPLSSLFESQLNLLNQLKTTANDNQKRIASVESGFERLERSMTNVIGSRITSLENSLTQLISELLTKSLAPIQTTLRNELKNTLDTVRTDVQQLKTEVAKISQRVNSQG